MKAIIHGITVLLITILFLSSCKQSDSEIESEIQKKQASDIKVKVAEGVVTLNGTVPTLDAKAKAEAIAKSEKNVKSVINNLGLPAPPPPPASAGIVLDDPLMTAVREAVINYPTITASVTDSVITLSGVLKKEKLPKLIYTLKSLKPKKIEIQVVEN